MTETYPCSTCQMYRKENDRQGICFGLPPIPMLMQNPRMQNGPPIIQGFRPPVGKDDTCVHHSLRKLPILGFTPTTSPPAYVNERTQ